MSITIEDVTYVANLSRIAFDQEESEQMAREMDGVLEYMTTLNKLDTTGVKPTEHILPMDNVFRVDVVKPSLPIEDVLANAPEEEAGCFKVPRVIE